jgi:hypothetical protein
MSLPFEEIVACLVSSDESEHFVIHYEVRNPLSGKGLGAHGVRNRELITTYQTALEKLYETMTSEPWNRGTPIVGADGKTHVYVWDSGGPFTTYDGLTKIPYIVLTSRNNEPTTQAELHRATSEAVHEATHLFNYSQRPLWNKIPARRWEWFDEGMAVLMEMLVAQDNPDHFRFLMDWIDGPERSLDDLEFKYQAGMFLDYVRKRVGSNFINDVWLKSEAHEEPLRALERFMPDGDRFFSSSADELDVFGGYCIDPYCLWDHASEVFHRYGERAVRESLRLTNESEYEIKDSLNHLSCRYYRFYLDPDVDTVEISMSNDDENSSLKAQVAVVTEDRKREMLQALRTAGNDFGPNAVVCILRGLKAIKIDHIVLVVGNCGTNLTVNGGFNRDDNQEYRLKARAVRA